MSDWHYGVNGGSAGPISRAELMELLRSGSVTEDTLVWTGQFGTSWKKLSDVPDLRTDEGPPPLPAAAVSDFWMWSLALVPIVGYFVERSLADTFGQLDVTLVMFGYFVTNTFLGYRDEQVIKASGRRTQATSFWAAAFLVPLYLFARNRRLGGSQYPLGAWVAGVVFSVYAAAGFTMPYLGFSAPGCNSAASIEQIKELFPRIPSNLLSLEAAQVRNINTTSSSGKMTTCSAEVVSSVNTTHAVTFTIEDRGDEYYYMLYLQ